MAETTGIGWTDKTHNEWIGCSAPAGAGCANCYAALWDRRFGGDRFGVGKCPSLSSEQNRNKPYRWERESIVARVRTKVFCGSLMDFFDKHAPSGARSALWGKIAATPNLDWQILTKRSSNIAKMLPPDWGIGYDNVWLGVTIEDRKSGLRRLEHLRAIPAKVKFVSIEPLLEDLGVVDFSGIDWAIIGGESGRACRPMKEEWVLKIIRQCREQGVKVFFKQWGGSDKIAGGCIVSGMEIKEFPRAAIV